MNEKITSKQIGELVAQSETGRITREMFQKFLENPGLVLGGVLERMLAACKFDWVNDNITPKNFPVENEPADDTEYELVCLEKYASTDEAEAEINNRGFLTATLADLLLYVRKNPEEQRKYPIVALGSRWQVSDGRWFSPCANGWIGKRFLSLYYREVDWRGFYRFLARKPR